MPKHAKHTKSDRDRGMITGLRMFKSKLSDLNIDDRFTSPEAVIAKYQEHLDAMRDATEKEIAWRTALERERTLEREIQTLNPRVQSFLRAVFGERNRGALARFGMRAFKVPTITAETKAAAAAKRLETRRLRRTMGRRQRKRTLG